MAKNPEEWMKQADYDMETAEYLYKGGRHFYAVFMCHLSLEKALKGIHQKKFNVIPSSINNLPYLVEKVQLQLPNEFSDMIATLNRLRLFPYYPDNLQKMLEGYDKEKMGKIIARGREALKWLKTMGKVE
ncbi:MAG: HEPN domain-containing protein [Candidatus Scalindua sp. AMX11]|nr:MAG: HEPN domain-containing protein [Candidatus Scalindua sp.]NOG85030.1 HEPN domain-containing protein [Planctomycetota bacterium]RZV93081.1 MAG: HEPN domain-containing protein [Candidatus Scalindua sp. SCAELEC01]TDE66707.1 MAG: HEPN domain-containing protein [Candidatus Scalindua sp. AMX11]GJQ58014.1 MAG: DNA-binding protein [Candidatus Scalindua sp.]